MDKKLQKERKMAFESLPPAIKDSLTEEERELFLSSEEWTEEMFTKLAEFIVND
ncbi:MAG: hypothetical protein MI747_04325 [Desulfobacterales bacterium]|nr:hypothetical protein [Desulfobacterales bacterium]